MVSTTNDIAGQPIAGCLGIVRGIVVRTPSIAQGFKGGLQSIFGGNGNIDYFTQVCDAARQDAFDRMVAHAGQLGADAVIGDALSRHGIRNRRDGSASLWHSNKTCG